MKVLLSLVFLVASCSQAVAHCGGPGVPGPMHLRAAARSVLPPRPATDADLARAERIAPRLHTFAYDLADRLGVNDDGTDIFTSDSTRGVSGSIDGSGVTIRVRW